MLAKVIEMKTGYIPAGRFGNDIVNDLANYIEKGLHSMFEDLQQNVNQPDMKELFSIGMNKAVDLFYQSKTKKAEIKIQGDEIIFVNSFCVITYNPIKKKFSGRDLTDKNNEPAFYNKTHRSHKKAAESLKRLFNDEMSMDDAVRILKENGVTCRTYSAMD